jgi:hypothetical protein
MHFQEAGEIRASFFKEGGEFRDAAVWVAPQHVGREAESNPAV